MYSRNNSALQQLHSVAPGLWLRTIVDTARNTHARCCLSRARPVLWHCRGCWDRTPDVCVLDRAARGPAVSVARPRRVPRP
eukprot:5307288-Prymnesium_polylepis.1